ncbi:hypothetical protein ACF064_01530 [Streptomyces sp. NPDC015492]|uniref:hypothetical protein n=1 Tax=Streptomyces sp. NPDC015492 TaxID=3364958 RepID=UPI0037011C18
MTDNLNDFPAPFLGGPLTGRTEGLAGKRNADGAALAFANCKAYGYVPVAAPAAGQTVTVDGEAKAVKATADGRPYVDVLSRKGETIAGWFGYPGSEHLMVAHCVLCGQTVTVYNSHVRRGSSHTGCTARGKAARVAAVSELTGAPVVAPGPQTQRNGSSAPVEAPAATEATEAKATAKKTRTRAVKASAASRPAPAPAARPPKPKAPKSASAPVGRPLGKVQWEALRMMFTWHQTAPNTEPGTWNTELPGWHIGASVSATVRVMESLRNRGLVTLDGKVYRMTDEGVSAYRAGHGPDGYRSTLTVDVDAEATGGGLEADADQAPELDADDVQAVGRLAERAGLTPAPRRPRSARAPKDDQAETFPALRSLLF